MESKLEFQLDMIERTVTRWLQFNIEMRAKEGLSSDDATALIAPTTWPHHGELKMWISVLQQARQFIHSHPPFVEAED